MQAGQVETIPNFLLEESPFSPVQGVRNCKIPALQVVRCHGPWRHTTPRKSIRFACQASSGDGNATARTRRFRQVLQRRSVPCSNTCSRSGHPLYPTTDPLGECTKNDYIILFLFIFYVPAEMQVTPLQPSALPGITPAAGEPLIDTPVTPRVLNESLMKYTMERAPQPGTYLGFSPPCDRMLLDGQG